MVPALILGLFRSEWGAVKGFSAAMILLLAAGLALRSVRVRSRDYYAREGFVTVGLSWLLLSIFGALPYWLSGSVPSYINAFFETVSGFTTTGASVLRDVEALPMSLLYWRSFTNWFGGMGILVFLLAISPLAGGGGESLHLLRAESPGVNVGKLVPRMRRSTAILYLIYIGITVLMFVLLVFDMPVFDALTTAFATAGTGGFSIHNAGMSVYSRYSQTVITVFMMLFSVNFTVYYFLLLGRFRSAIKNEELWVFLGIAGAAALFIAFNIRTMYGDFGLALHNSAFTVASVMSTSGFAIADFDTWPWVSKTILVLLMFIGACAGSTGGGMKVIRLIILSKQTRRSIRLAMRPREVCRIHMDGEVVDDDTVNGVTGFFLLYIAITALTVLLLSLDGCDFTTTFTAAVSCVNNIGPALGEAGPMMNYTCFSVFGKLLLSFGMLFGRLELYPMMLLFIPSAWRK